jgi:hypothetical protein
MTDAVLGGHRPGLAGQWLINDSDFAKHQSQFHDIGKGFVGLVGGHFGGREATHPTSPPEPWTVIIKINYRRCILLLLPLLTSVQCTFACGFISSPFFLRSFLLRKAFGVTRQSGALLGSLARVTQSLHPGLSSVTASAAALVKGMF